MRLTMLLKKSAGKPGRGLAQRRIAMGPIYRRFRYCIRYEIANVSFKVYLKKLCVATIVTDPVPSGASTVAIARRTPQRVKLMREVQRLNLQYNTLILLNCF